MKNKKLNILIDFDGVIANTDKAVYDLYIEMTGEIPQTHYSKHKNWYYDDICPLWDRRQQNSVFINPKLFELLQPNKGMVELLQQLKNEGHNISIVTVHNAEGILYKHKWIKNYLPFVDSVVYVSGINGETTLNKSMVTGDILIDDNVNNLNSVENTTKYQICFGNYMYNNSWNGIRANDSKELKDIINKVINESEEI